MKKYTPACLPPKEFELDYIGESAWVYGWGREADHPKGCDPTLFPKPKPSPVLRETTVDIISNDECEKSEGIVRKCSKQDPKNPKSTVYKYKDEISEDT